MDSVPCVGPYAWLLARDPAFRVYPCAPGLRRSLTFVYPFGVSCAQLVKPPLRFSTS